MKYANSGMVIGKATRLATMAARIRKQMVSRSNMETSKGRQREERSEQHGLDSTPAGLVSIGGQPKCPANHCLPIPDCPTCQGCTWLVWCRSYRETDEETEGSRSDVPQRDWRFMPARRQQDDAKNASKANNAHEHNDNASGCDIHMKSSETGRNAIVRPIILTP